MIFFSAILYFAGGYVAETFARGQIILVVALGLMCLASFSITRGKLLVQDGGILIYILVFLCYCALSLVWAQSWELGIHKINALLFIFIAMVILYLSTGNVLGIDDLLKVIMYGGYIVVLYATVRYGFSGMLRLLQSDSRITNDLFNANTLGMCAAYSIIINFFFILNGKISFRDILMVPAGLLLVVSQSRKAVIVVILGVIGIYVLRNISKKGFGVNMIKVLVGIGAILFLFFLISKIPFMQPIVMRLQEIVEMVVGNGKRGQNSAWIRFAYMELGLNLFREHPVFGIGIGNANIYTQMYYGHSHYLHNNYVELLACGGLVGFLIYYSIWIYLLFIFIRYFKYRNKQYDICLVLFLVNLVMDYGAVSYYDKATYFFLLMYWLLRNKLVQQKENALQTVREQKGVLS